MFVGIVLFHKPKGKIKVYTAGAYNRPAAKARVVELAQSDGSEIETIWVQRCQPASTRLIWAEGQTGGGGSRRK